MINEKKLYRREIVQEIEKFLDSPEIIVLHGARQVGKTSIMLYISDEIKAKEPQIQTYYFDLEIPRFLELGNSGHEAFYEYLLGRGYDKNTKAFVFIDEIQYLTDPSKFLKLFHDNYKGNVKMIVSGSSSFEIKSKFKNSLVGRTMNFEIWPLDFSEFLAFKQKKYSLKKENRSPAIGEELAELWKEYAKFGGYPQIVLEHDITKKEAYLRQIIDTYIKKDIRDLANIQNLEKFNKLVTVLASQSGKLLNVSELGNTTGLSRPTIEHYLFLLENTYVIKLLLPYSKSMRGELFKTPKVYLVDSGIANLLSFKEFPQILGGDIFETAFFGELLKRNPKLNLYFWRTAAKQEVDFIVEEKKQIIPIEVKSNSEKANLTSLKYFMEKHNVFEGKIVFLEGKDKYAKDGVEYIYPWEA
jgi:predicted AAA+ superfamily ATPase